MDMAIANDCAIITTPYDAMKVARYIYQTPPVSMIMTKDIVTFKISDYVDDVYNRNEIEQCARAVLDNIKLTDVN